MINVYILEWNKEDEQNVFGDIRYIVTHASAGSHKTEVVFSNGLIVEFQGTKIILVKYL